MKLVCKTQFGSHLYGTATPTSDIDIRGIFIPSKRDILLGRIPKTNKDNGVSTDDYELYSLHHFVKLACEGQTVALDMLWTPARQIERGEAGRVWDQLRALRHKFLSTNMNAFVGYARGQATKYSLKGGRLNKLMAFLDVLKSANQDNTILGCIWNALPKDAERVNPQGVREVQIAGKWYGECTQVGHVRYSVQHIIDGYGMRTNAAAKDGGVDWKAMSHAVRVSLELRELLITHEIKFPLTHANVLLDIKRGHMSLEAVQYLLDHLLANIEELTLMSNLPKSVDHIFWENWLVATIESEII